MFQLYAYTEASALFENGLDFAMLKTSCTDGTVVIVLLLVVVVVVVQQLRSHMPQTHWV